MEVQYADRESLMAALQDWSGTHHTLELSEDTAWVGFLDSSRPAAIWIESGDTLTTSTRPVAGGNLYPEISLEEALEHRAVYKRQGYSSHTLTGPVGVRGAEPGDALEVRILRLVPEEYCYTYSLPEGGFLAGDGIPAHLTVCPVDREKGVVCFSEHIAVPLRPMLGIVAVAPREEGRINAGNVGEYGGNMDWPGMGEGSVLFLPVLRPGALLCVGDAHASQGGGEVSGNSMEVGMRDVTIQVLLHKEAHLRGPCAETATHWVRFAFHEELAEAARMVLRDAIGFLCAHKGLSKEEAYHLCSNCVDLHITQLVNRKFGVHAQIPKCIFID